MVKFIFLIIFILAILFILKNKRQIVNDKKNQKKYNILIFLVTLFAIFFILITSGKLLFPQLLQIIKIGVPFLTKFIGL